MGNNQREGLPTCSPKAYSGRRRQVHVCCYWTTKHQIGFSWTTKHQIRTSWTPEQKLRTSRPMAIESTDGCDSANAGANGYSSTALGADRGGSTAANSFTVCALVSGRLNRHFLRQIGVVTAFNCHCFAILRLLD